MSYFFSIDIPVAIYCAQARFQLKFASVARNSVS
jgi:hypothetical protein